MGLGCEEGDHFVAHKERECLTMYVVGLCAIARFPSMTVSEIDNSPSVSICRVSPSAVCSISVLLEFDRVGRNQAISGNLPMVTEQSSQQQTGSVTKNLPPLENGDRLTRNEFERRYQAMTHLKKAELIEGVVYVPSPLRFEPHAEPHGDLITWLGTYKVMTPGARLGDNPTVRLDLDNEPQPDAVLLIDEAAGGQSRLDKDGYVEGAPELVVEVAASSSANDLYDKKTVYRRNSVREYIVWQVFDQKLDWFVLSEGRYDSLEADESGIIRSEVFPGLWLAVSALLDGDMPSVLATVQEGLNSSEHSAFVKQLSQ
jgi:Uma2 family endonuclease